MITHTARGLIALFPLSCLLLCAPSALACSLLGPEPHALVEASDDATPPAMPELQGLTISRGHGPSFGGVATSCDDIGFITLSLATEDDTSSAAAIGYQLKLVDGTLPFELPAEAVRPQVGADLVLTWIDGATRDQEALSATLEIIAVDEAGNLSDQPLTVALSDPGSGAGCATLPHAGAWALIGALAAWRRRPAKGR